MKKENLIIWGIGLLVLAGVAFGVWKMSQSSSTALQLSEPVLSTDHIEGDPNSKAVLIEYGDFQCPACGAYFPIVEKVVSDYNGQLLFVFRNFPLPQHQNAVPAAYAAGAAANQGKFWEMYRQLYTNQNDWADSTDPQSFFTKYAQAIGLNMTQYQTDVTSSAVADKVTHDIQTGTNSGIDATPTFFLNGVQIQPQSEDDFKQLIDKALAS